MDEVVSDKISDLPEDVINIILSRVPLPDAARTSVLSTKWKLHWKRTDCLIVDDSLLYKFIPKGLDDEKRLSSYVGIVKDILSSHKVPVREFHLFIPCFWRIPHSDDINRLVLCVSRVGVQDLTLEFEEDDNEPSYVFLCSELKHLSLKFARDNLNLEAPMELPTHHFKKLSSLVSLEFCRELVNGDELTEIISYCPLLERLCLDYNQIISKALVISAPRLKFLSVTFDDFVDLILKNTPTISALLLRQKEIGIEGRHENIVSFFDVVPNLETIGLNGYILTKWNQHNVPERLPVLLDKHLSLTVSDLNMYSPAQTRSMFCLIKSSPRLQTLYISICPTTFKPKDAAHYLKSQLTEVETLSSLRTVKIAGFKGERLEMCFIAVVLSRCPNLQKICLGSGDILISSAA